MKSAFHVSYKTASKASLTWRAASRVEKAAKKRERAKRKRNREN